MGGGNEALAMLAGLTGGGAGGSAPVRVSILAPAFARLPPCAQFTACAMRLRAQAPAPGLMFMPAKKK